MKRNILNETFCACVEIEKDNAGITPDEAVEMVCEYMNGLCPQMNKAQKDYVLEIAEDYFYGEEEDDE